MPTTASTVLRVTLVVSLALNLFAAGWFASSAWKHDGHSKRGWHSSSGMHPRELREVLPKADREKLNALMPEHREQIRARIRAVHEARRGVAEALRAQPFDSDKVGAAFALVREREAAVATEAQLMLIQLAAEVSPKGREKMAQQMLKRKHHRKPRGDEPDGGREGPPPQ